MLASPAWGSARAPEAGSGLPVLGLKPDDAREFRRVVGNERKVVNECDGGDHQVVGADGVADCLQFMPDTAIDRRGGIIERKRCIRGERFG